MCTEYWMLNFDRVLRGRGLGKMSWQNVLAKCLGQYSHPYSVLNTDRTPTLLPYAPSVVISQELHQDDESNKSESNKSTLDFLLIYLAGHAIRKRSQVSRQVPSIVHPVFSPQLLDTIDAAANDACLLLKPKMSKDAFSSLHDG